MSNKDLVKYWLDSSKQDWETVEALMKSRRYMHALFFCHLSLEKYLKGMVAKKNGVVSPTHDLLFLAEKAEIELTKDQAKLLAEVKEFNIRTRYDDYKNSFYKKATAAYAQKFISQIKDFKTWLEKL
jgi:HEPN domain-containing protein